MQTEMKEKVHMKIEGEIADLFIRMNPNKYQRYARKEKGKTILYVRLKKALYGILQGAILSYRNLRKYLVDTLALPSTLMTHAPKALTHETTCVRKDS